MISMINYMDVRKKEKKGGEGEIGAGPESSSDAEDPPNWRDMHQIVLENEDNKIKIQGIKIKREQ